MNVARAGDPGRGHVFVSYANPDRVYVDRLASFLTAHGLRVWYDRHIAAGARWARVVREKIDNSVAVVVVMSPDAEGSRWVAREIARAEEIGRPIFPLLLRGRRMFQLAEIQYEGVAGGQMPTREFVQRLTQASLRYTPADQAGKVHLARVWAIPTPEPGLAVRPDLAEPLIASLIAPAVADPAITAALVGAGGFGKTTLAKQICADPRISERFISGVWITIGQNISGVPLAEKVNDVYYQLAGERPNLSDPEQAGLRLGALLDRLRDVLLVIDDVWTDEQLRAFSQSGTATCTRLVTTRRPAILNPDVSHAAVTVQALTNDQAQAVLTTGLAELTDTDVMELLDLTGRWPLLVQLAHRRLARDLRNGKPAHTVVAALCSRLRAGGPEVLDLRDASRRDRAVAASIHASMDLLSVEAQDRFMELGVFQEDIDIPRDVLALLWGATAGLSPHEVEQLCELLIDLSLVAEQPFDRLAVHDVIRNFVRHRGHERLTETNRALVQAASRLLPAPADTTGGDHQWWLLPQDDDYLWRHLCQHLHGAKRHDELTNLVTDLRWIEAKLARDNPLVVDIDLAFAPDSVAARALRKVVRQNAHILTPIAPRQAVADTLISRLRDTPELAGTLVAYAATTTAGRRLSSMWPLHDQPHPALHQVLANHLAPVVACAFSRDGALLATACHDGLGRIWDVATGSLRQTLAGHAGTMVGCAFHPDGSSLATIGDDAVARIWNVRTGALRHTLLDHTGALTGCAFSPDGRWLATASQDSTIKLWDTATATLAHTLSGHEGAVRRCAISPDGTYIASVGDDGAARVWDVATGTVRHILVGHDGPVVGCAISPNGAWLATTSDDAMARVWDVTSGKLRQILVGHRQAVTSCEFGPDATWLATTSADETARIWDVNSGTTRHTLVGHTSAVVACAVDPDGRWLVTCSRGGTARQWDVSDGELRQTFTGHTGSVWTCPVTSDGRWLATASSDGSVRTWHLATEATPQHPLVGNRVMACAVSPDGSRLATASKDRFARIWAAATGDLHHSLDGHQGSVLACVFSGDGELLATASDDGSARIWDAVRGEARHNLLGHTNLVRGCAFGPDSSFLVTTSDDATARIWDTDTGATRHVLVGHEGPVSACAISPDGRLLATASGDASIRMWNTATGSLSHVLTGHSGPVTACAISADGSLLATAGSDATARTWNVSNGQPLHVFTGHAGPLTACHVLQDAALLITTSCDGTARIWDITTGASQHILIGHSGQVNGCAISPDGDWLATVGDDATLRMWALPSGHAQTAVRVGAAINSVTWFPDSSGVAFAGAAGAYAFAFSGG